MRAQLHVFGHQVGARGQSADADVLAVFAASLDGARESRAQPRVVEFADDAHFCSQVVAADEQHVHTLDSSNVFNVFERIECFHHHRHQGCVIERGHRLNRGKRAELQLRRAAGIPKGSAKNLQTMVGSVTRAQIREIAQTKLPDLNTNDIEDAIRSIEGSARSMGIEIK